MKYRLVDGLLITMRYIDEVEYRLVGGLYNYNKLFQYKGYSTPACGSAHARNGHEGYSWVNRGRKKATVLLLPHILYLSMVKNQDGH